MKLQVQNGKGCDADPGPGRLRAIADRYERELLESCVPFWERHGPDPEYGGFFNFLDREGRPYDSEKSMWMQWRIVYTFATLSSTCSHQDNWLDLARQGFDFLTRHGKASNGNYYFSLRRDGEPLAAPYSLYSDCFAAMGAAALFQVTSEERYQREAESAFSKYLHAVKHPGTQWDKAMSGQPQRLSFGHYMILANLGSVMNQCLGKDEYLCHVDEASQMIMGTFWKPKRRQLFESLNLDGSVALDTCDGRQLNPGHGLEAMWFLLRALDSNGDHAFKAQACEIVLSLLETGWDPEYGGFFYFMDADGRPRPELEWDMKLWWVHNEALLACLHAYRASDDPQFIEWFKRIDEWAWQHFRDPEHGEWFGYTNRHGQVTHTFKGSRWKCFFHLPRCLLLGSQLLREIAEAQERATETMTPSHTSPTEQQL